MRIASLSPAVTETLFALGLEKQIVCRDQFSRFPDDAEKIPQVMGHTDVEISALRAHQPDLVFTSTVIQQKLAEKLRSAGMSVVHDDPRTLAGVYESIRHVAAILNCEQASQEIVDRMQKELSAVKKKAALLGGKRLKIYTEEWHDPPMASGNWVPELVRIAGGEPFPIAPGELSRAVTLEEVQRFDPDLIVISWCGAGLLADPALLRNRPGWNQLRAISTHGGLRVIDDSLLNRPGPRLVEGAQRLYGWMFELLH